MFKRIVFATILALTGPMAVPAFANSVSDSAVSQLRRQGYNDIQVRRTLLGRIHIVANSDTYTRELVIHPITGEVMRDRWSSGSGSESAPAPISIDPDDNDGGDAGADDGMGSGDGDSTGDDGGDGDGHSDGEGDGDGGGEGDGEGDGDGDGDGGGEGDGGEGDHD